MMIHTIDLQFQDIPQTIGAFLIEHEQGPILVETGPYSTFERLVSELTSLNVDWKSIRAVLVSHIHLDHAGSAWAFAQHGIPVYVHPKGAKHLIDPSRLMHSAKRIYQDMMDTLWGRMEAIPEEYVITVQDEEVIFDGNQPIQAIHSPGHAVHHIAWKCGDVLFAGDVAGVRIGSRGLVVPPCPPPEINLEDWSASITRIRAFQIKTMYLTHFGPITDISNHLDALETRLYQWANWIKPRYESGKSIAEVTPEFEAYVENELIAHGLNENELTQYRAANPAWMSVSGLFRYWKKKEEA